MVGQDKATSSRPITISAAFVEIDEPIAVSITRQYAIYSQTTELVTHVDNPRHTRRSFIQTLVRAPCHDPTRWDTAGEPDVVQLGRHIHLLHQHPHTPQIAKCGTRAPRSAIDQRSRPAIPIPRSTRSSRSSRPRSRCQTVHGSSRTLPTSYARSPCRCSRPRHLRRRTPSGQLPVVKCQLQHDWLTIQGRRWRSGVRLWDERRQDHPRLTRR